MPKLVSNPLISEIKFRTKVEIVSPAKWGNKVPINIDVLKVWTIRPCPKLKTSKFLAIKDSKTLSGLESYDFKLNMTEVRIPRLGIKSNNAQAQRVSAKYLILKALRYLILDEQFKDKNENDWK